MQTAGRLIRPGFVGAAFFLRTALRLAFLATGADAGLSTVDSVGRVRLIDATSLSPSETLLVMSQLQFFD
jgi:hypothetical protein